MVERPSHPSPERARPGASKALAPEVAELVEQMSSLVKKVQDVPRSSNPPLYADRAEQLARGIQTKIAKLGGVASPRHPAVKENITQTTLDAYKPGRDAVCPISVRASAMELLWVCGDCGEHYPRSLNPPETCPNCSAPREHFYSPVED
jgi:rubrerythrin